MLKHYILLWRDDSYRFIGPFDTYEECADWGNYMHNMKAWGDDPRWHTIKMDPAKLLTPPMQRTAEVEKACAAKGDD